MTRTQITLTAAGAALAGAAIGAAVGVLFAPASGTEVRRRIAWRMRDERKAMERWWDDTAARVAKQAARAKATITA
jgi:gas vesicle protein